MGARSQAHDFLGQGAGLAWLIKKLQHLRHFQKLSYIAWHICIVRLEWMNYINRALFSGKVSNCD